MRSEYGWAFILAGIFLLLFAMNRRGKKLKKKNDISDREFEAWKQQFHTWNRKDNTHLNVQRRVRERRNRK